MRGTVTRGAVVAIAGVAGMMLGCIDRSVVALIPEATKEQKIEAPIGYKNKLDLLVEVDNSGSMARNQSQLVANFPRLIARLDSVLGGRPDLHIGVITSNMGAGGYPILRCANNGDNGVLQNTARTPGCPTPTDIYISDAPGPMGTRIINYPGGAGNLSNVFSCIAQVGTNGCGFERHLDAMKAALDGTNAQNSGFLRDDAFLAFLLIADEDDCSVMDTSMFNPDATLSMPTGMLGPLASFRCTEFGVECDGGTIDRNSTTNYTTCQPRRNSPYMPQPHVYVDFLNSLKSDPTLILATAIVGVPGVSTGPNLDGEQGSFWLNPSCRLPADCPPAIGAASSCQALAWPPVRTASFISQFGTQGTLTSLCSADQSGAMDQIANALAAVLGRPCLGGNIQTNPLDCSVSITVNHQEQVVPPCSAGGNPCWSTNVNAACPGTNMELVLGPAGYNPPAGAVLNAHCVSL
jgi:hypothetical protein